MEIQFIPFKKVGSFRLEDSIENYPEYKFNVSKGHESTNWTCYALDDEGIELYVEDGIIVTIACRKECYLHSFNLIGTEYNTFLNRFKLSKEREHDRAYMANDDDYQDIYEVDEIGAQIWCREGIIVTVFCSPELDE